MKKPLVIERLIPATGVVISYAAEGGAGYGGGDSATLSDSASLQPADSLSDWRKS